MKVKFKNRLVSKQRPCLLRQFLYAICFFGAHRCVALTRFFLCRLAKKMRKIYFAFFWEKSKASASLLVLVFFSVLSISVLGILSSVVMQSKLLDFKKEKFKAFDIAESGLYIAKFLYTVYADRSDNPLHANGHLQKDIKDPKSGQTVARLNITANNKLSCGKLQFVDIVSNAQSAKNPKASSVISARLMKPSVANYSFLLDSVVWLGSTESAIGPFHSNDGVRMDGFNNSVVSSAKTIWLCDSSVGCNPAQYKTGVFGAGSNYKLWKYPVPAINFNDFHLDLNEIKNLAQSSGIYLQGFTGYYGNDSKGYRLVFKDDGSVDVYKVLASTGVWGYNPDYGYKYSWWWGWRYEYNTPAWQTFLGNFSIPSDCSVIFSEEKLWIEGTVKGKVSVFVGRVSGYYEPEVVATNNILYSSNNGSDGLLVYAKSFLRISDNAPSNLTLNGIFVSENASVGMSYYSGVVKNLLKTNGTIVSKKRVVTNWLCGGITCSGYPNQQSSYDRFLRYDPPPFTPAISDKYLIVNWREK